MRVVALRANGGRQIAEYLRAVTSNLYQTGLDRSPRERHEGTARGKLLERQRTAQD